MRLARVPGPSRFLPVRVAKALVPGVWLDRIRVQWTDTGYQLWRRSRSGVVVVMPRSVLLLLRRLQALLNGPGHSTFELVLQSWGHTGVAKVVACTGHNTLQKWLHVIL